MTSILRRGEGVRVMFVDFIGLKRGQAGFCHIFQLKAVRGIVPV